MGVWRQLQRMRHAVKVLLIRPPSHHCIETEVPEAVRKENVSYPPLALISIATFLKEQTHHQVEILDGLLDAMSYPELQRRIAQAKPDVVGITTFTVELIDALKTVQAARAVGVEHILLGGPHVNDFPAEAADFPGITAAVCGEAQASLPQILERLENNTSLRGIPGVLLRGEVSASECIERPMWSDDLDSYPMLDRTVAQYQRYYDVLGKGELFTTTITSRGCPYKCTFCNTPRDRYRTQSPERICDEVAECLKLGIREVYFVDDTFNITNARVADLCHEILRRNLKFSWTVRFRVKGVDRELLTLMKRAGCNRIQFGVEQATDEALLLLQKGVTIAEIENAFRLCREVGIKTVAYFMIGCPTERTRADVLRTIDFSIRLKPDFVMYNVLTPFPGTTLYDEGLARGVLDIRPWMDFILNPSEDFVPQIWDEHFKAEQLSEFLHLAYRKFYWRPSVIMQNLKELNNARDFVRKAKAGLLLLKPREMQA